MAAGVAGDKHRNGDMAERISEDTLARMAATFRILADTSRLAILNCLIENGEVSVGQAVEATDRQQTNVSKHLKLMAEAGLLTRRKEGLQVYYRLVDPVWEQVCRLVRSSLPRARNE
jgi:DNA-binding transcriptional ArsR family regulator